VLLAFGVAYYFTVEPAPRVNIRWREGVDDDRRARLERSFLLVETGRDQRTYFYDLLDTSPENLRAILREPAVEDTYRFDPRTLTFPPDYAYGPSWMWVAHRTPVLRVPGVVEGIVAVCAAIAGTGVIGLAVRRFP
jgi:hypothetical protein